MFVYIFYSNDIQKWLEKMQRNIQDLFAEKILFFVKFESFIPMWIIKEFYENINFHYFASKF